MYNRLRNFSFKCYELDAFEAFIKNMTQEQFYSVWKKFSNLKVSDLFFTNSVLKEGDVIEITMSSFGFY